MMNGFEKAAAGLLALTIVLQCCIAAVVATTLDGAGGCLMNVAGGDPICGFTYVSTGAVLALSLALLALLSEPVRGRPLPAPAVFVGAAALSFFWQMVEALTVTLRGGTADNHGVAEGGARAAVYALTWIGACATLFAGAAVAAALWRSRRPAPAARGKPAAGGAAANGGSSAVHRKGEEAV